MFVSELEILFQRNRKMTLRDQEQSLIVFKTFYLLPINGLIINYFVENYDLLSTKLSKRLLVKSFKGVFEAMITSYFAIRDQHCKTLWIEIWKAKFPPKFSVLKKKILQLPKFQKKTESLEKLTLIRKNSNETIQKTSLGFLIFLGWKLHFCFSPRQSFITSTTDVSASHPISIYIVFTFYIKHK